MLWGVVVWIVAPVVVGWPHRTTFSWDTVPVFFHSCNESGLYSPRALQTITKFPIVTIEKGQAYDVHDGTYAEDKIALQCAAIKKINPNITTVFYMNSVKDWYFYRMHTTLLQNPSWELHDKNGKVVHVGADKHFNPPKEGVLVFDHSQVVVQRWWESVCINATKTGHVDGCFADSSQKDGSGWNLGPDKQAAWGKGLISTMTNTQLALGSAPLIGKTGAQLGVHAAQIEFFEANEASIVELQIGVKAGKLMQAHWQGTSCEGVADTLAAFLIGAGEYSYYGFGPWISQGIQDVEGRWCQEFDRPLGKPLGNATKVGNVYHRSFGSGTKVQFNVHTKKGGITWGH